jgi:serine/threonine-protein kinase RsbW
MEAITRQYQDLDPDRLASIRDFIETSAAQFGANEDQAGELVLAVHEATANIVTHGYKKSPSWISISISKEPGQLVVRLLDRSPPFDPTQLPPFDITLPLEERPYGGMGVHMIRSFSDEIRYRTLPLGDNELTIIKRINNGPGS